MIIHTVNLMNYFKNALCYSKMTLAKVNNYKGGEFYVHRIKNEVRTN